MKQSSYLRVWLEGRMTLKNIDKIAKEEPDYNAGFWLELNYSCPLHLVNDERIYGLEESWKLNKEYFEAAKKKVRWFNGDIDHEDRYEILETLGEPPDVCHPIYIITVKNANKEEVVYVGKTISKKARFNGGHLVALKLLNPIYDGFTKQIYFGHIMLFTKSENHLPVDLLRNKKLAKTIVNDTETKLIRGLNPPLNTNKKGKPKSLLPFSILIANRLNSLLNDELFV